MNTKTKAAPHRQHTAKDQRRIVNRVRKAMRIAQTKYGVEAEPYFCFVRCLKHGSTSVRPAEIRLSLRDLARLRPSELAFVIWHEIEHLRRQHCIPIAHPAKRQCPPRYLWKRLLAFDLEINSVYPDVAERLGGPVPGRGILARLPSGQSAAYYARWLDRHPAILRWSFQVCGKKVLRQLGWRPRGGRVRRGRKLGRATASGA